MNPVYSIIIPTYNKCSELLAPCLESIIKFTDLSNVEIIVVANGCTDETKDYISQQSKTFPQIKLIWFEKNLGYAKATNEGIKISTGEYVILLNNDTILLDQAKNDWINIMRKPFYEDDKMGITAPMKSFSESANRHFLILFCCMISRKVIETIGLLDEIFWSYCEDISYCIEAENAGFKIKQVPVDSNEFYADNRMKGQFPIYHIGNVTHKDIPNGSELITRNNNILRERYNKPKPEETSRSKITVGIPTKDRYESLSHTLLSIAFQTVKPYEIIIVDDSDDRKDIRAISQYQHILKLLDEYKIKWQVVFKNQKGPHHSHQLVQEISQTPLIFRVDDDCVLEPNVLEKLLEKMVDGIGAVAPLVLMTNTIDIPPNAENKIDNIHAPNIQWFKWSGIREVDHLYSCFLYRKGIDIYELSLSPVSHREETIFSHKIKRAGYKLLVNSEAKVWHFRCEKGGIRSHQSKKFYDDDEMIFKGLLNLWNVNSDRKLVVLDAGLGDHFAFKNILPDLKKRFNKITIAACFPDVFWDEKDLDLISIADAKQTMNIDFHNIYRRMIDWSWSKNIVGAFRKLYLS